MLKVAFSRKGLWKYTILRFFINFSSKFFDRACDWLDLNSNFYPQPITSSVKKFRGKNDEKLENQERRHELNPGKTKSPVTFDRLYYRSLPYSFGNGSSIPKFQGRPRSPRSPLWRRLWEWYIFINLFEKKLPLCIEWISKKIFDNEFVWDIINILRTL